MRIRGWSSDVCSSDLDCLWAYHNVGGLRAGVIDLKYQLPVWARRRHIVDDEGKPLPLLLSRLRKTHKALWYTKTEGHMARFAVGHSREVAARHNADLPSLRQLGRAHVRTPVPNAHLICRP